jgi:hypothetical protein
MTTWDYRTYDIRTGAFLAQVDLTRYGVTDELSKIGSFSGTLQLGDNREQTLVAKTATTPGKTSLVAFRDGQPIFGGPIWRRLKSVGANGTEVQIAGRGWMSYYERFPVSRTALYTNYDQHDIFRSLVYTQELDYTGGKPGGFAWDFNDSGVLRDRSYFWWERKQLAEALMQLSEVDNGFDWAMRPELNAGVLTPLQLRLWYPRRGRTFAQTQLTWRTGLQVIVLSEPEDATKLAGQIYTIGAGDGEATVHGVASSQELYNAGFPPYTATIPFKTISEQASIDAAARGKLAYHGRVDWDDFDVQIDPSFEDMPWGSWDLGDDVRLVVEEDLWHDVSEVYDRRIVAHAWDVDENGERLTVRLKSREV